MKRIVLCVVAALIAGSCSEPLEPNALTPVTITACRSGGVWFAYRNEDGPWTKLTPDAAGQMMFAATRKVTFAAAYLSTLEGFKETHVFNASPEELKSMQRALLCAPPRGTRSLSGTVSGASGQSAFVSAGGQMRGGAFTPISAWTLSALRDGPMDLIAARYPGSLLVDRFIVRRGIVPNGQQLPVLDFSSSEAVAPSFGTMTLSNVPPSSTLLALTFLATSPGDLHLYGITDVAGSSFPFQGLPPSVRVSTDLHATGVTATSENNLAFRHAAFYFAATPTSQLLTFGPALAQATVTTVATSPYRRVRMTIPSQPEYPDAAGIDLFEGPTTIRIITTAAYLGATPAEWDMTLPDMTEAGYQAAWGLSPSGSFSWAAGARKASVRTVLGGMGQDGEVMTAANRFNDPPAMARARRFP